MKEAKISQELSRIHEQMEKNNGVALKSSLEKGKSIVESTSSKKKESDNESDEDMTLFIKRFKKVMKRDGYFNNKRRGKITIKSNKQCFGCGEVCHFIADCPNPKNKNKGKKKNIVKLTSA
jgi:hypothetical protein